MPGPFIFIATNRLRDGRFDAEQQRVPELVRFVEAHEPRLIAFNEYVNEDRSQVSVVQFHPDASIRCTWAGSHAPEKAGRRNSRFIQTQTPFAEQLDILSCRM